jgi:hypothetical protein
LFKETSRISDNRKRDLNRIMKKSYSRIALGAAFSSLMMFSALGQNATPAQGIGPAPAHSKQDKMLNGALSQQTRQTLQEAMNSTAPADMATPAAAK